MARPLGTNAQTMRTAPNVLIDLETEEGITGHACLFCYTQMAPPLIAPVLGDIQDAVRGERLTPVDFAIRLGATLLTAWCARDRAHGARRLRCGVLGCAVVGRRTAAGQLYRVPAPLRPSLRQQRARPDAAGAGRRRGVGAARARVRAVKLHLGRPTAEQNLAVVRAVRRGPPDAVALMADYNQALTVTEAIQRGQGLDGEGLYRIEEPTPHDDYAECARVAAALITPVQIGENFAGAQAMATALSALACNYVMPDLERIGGVTGWQRAAALACAAGIEMSSHIFQEVSAHLLAATPTCHAAGSIGSGGPAADPPDHFAATARAGRGDQHRHQAVRRRRDREDAGDLRVSSPRHGIRGKT
jgi:mandelate racemase